MEHWEFLIQKEGDQAWLPLETHQVEILAGRYQVVAHTSHIDTAVEVRVSQMILDEVPPRRRVRKRLGQTDADGLIRVIPFIWLQQGRWELSCSSTSVADELLGQGWQHSIQLQVLPLTEAEQDWSPEAGADEERAAAATHPEPDPEPNLNPPTRSEDDIAPVVYPGAEALTEQIVSSLHELGEPILGADAPPLFQAQARSQPTEIAPDSGYRISLRQQAYLAQRQKPLVIIGQIQLDADAQMPTLLEGQLWIRLRHPQTGQPILETHRRLQAAPLPVDFKLPVQLPVPPETRIILGEVLLRSGTAETGPPVLAATAFTIRTGLDDLLEALASPAELSFDEEISVFPGTTVPFGQPRPRPATLISPDLPLMPLPPQSPKGLVPAVGQILPPQLDYRASESKSARDRAPQLPVFAPATSALSRSDRPAVRLKNSQPQGENSSDSRLFLETNDREADVWSDPIAEPAVEAEAGQFEEPTPRPTAANEPQPLQKCQKPQIHLPKFPSAHRQPAIFDGDSIADSDLDADSVASTLAELDSLGQRPVRLSPAAALSKPDSHSFRAEPPQPSTGLSNRFMSRLSDLTHASRQATTELRRLMQAAGVQSPERVNPESPPPPEPATALPGEVVIDDEPPLAILVEPRAEGTAAEIISPVIAIPNRELIAGETIALTVRLRPQQFQLYIKLWASNRQTRTLIGEPQLLMDLTPNHLGELEAQLPMPIPSDCLEIQFAAIAIDAETHQESDKAVVNRQIGRHDLPNSSFDDRV